MNTPTINRTLAATLAVLVLTGMIGLISFVCVDPASSCDLTILDDACTLCSTRQRIDLSLPRQIVPNHRNSYTVPTWPVSAHVITTMTAARRPLLPVPDPVTSAFFPASFP